MSLGRFFPGTLCLWTFCLGTFCPLGRFVPWDVLSWDVLSVHPWNSQNTKISILYCRISRGTIVGTVYIETHFLIYITIMFISAYLFS